MSPSSHVGLMAYWANRAKEVKKDMPAFGESPRKVVRGVQKVICGASALLRRRELESQAKDDCRLKAHWATIRADPPGCRGFLQDYGSWTRERYRQEHYPDDDVDRAARVAIARHLCIPLVEEGARCRGCNGELDVFMDHALVCTGGAGGCMAAYKTKRHDECCATLFRLGQAAGLTPGWNIDREVHYFLSGSIPGDIQVTEDRARIRASAPAADRGDIYREHDGAPPGAAAFLDERHDTGTRETAYDVTITATQHINSLHQFGASTAAHGAGTSAKEAAKRKIKAFNAMVLASAPETLVHGHGRLAFQPLAMESSGFAAPAVRDLVNKWEKCAKKRLGIRAASRVDRDGHKLPPRSSTRQTLSSVIHYWNSVCLILRGSDDLRVRKTLSLMVVGQ